MLSIVFKNPQVKCSSMHEKQVNLSVLKSAGVLINNVERARLLFYLLSVPDVVRAPTGDMNDQLITCMT